jgi:hypothetical protein
MKGGQNRRFCDRCRHAVNNLSEMTREEAAAVLAGAADGKRVCVRYRRGADGAIQFKSPRGPWSPARTFLRRAAAVAAGLLVFIRLGTTAQAENTEQGDVAVPSEHRLIMGEIQGSPQVLPSATPTPAATPELSTHTMGIMTVPQNTPTPPPAPEIMGKAKG